MAIEFVRKQTGRGGGVNTFDLIFDAAPSAGNFLVGCYSVWMMGGLPNAIPTGCGTWTTTTPPPGGPEWNAYINFCENASGSGTTVTIDYGSAFYIGASVAEFSGLVTSGSLDQQQGNSHTDNTDLTPDVGPTGALSQADELVVMCLAATGNSTESGIDACTLNGSTTGVVNLFTEYNGVDYMGHSSDYKIVSETSAVTAAWGTLNPGNAFWSAKIATFKAAGGAAPSVSNLMLMNLGK